MHASGISWSSIAENVVIILLVALLFIQLAFALNR